MEECHVTEMADTMSKELMAKCLEEALQLLLDSTALNAEEEPKPGELTAVATIAVALYQERMREKTEVKGLSFGSTLMVVTADGIVHSTDNGETWHHVEGVREDATIKVTDNRVRVISQF